MNPKMCDFNLAIIYMKGLRRIRRGTPMCRAPEIIERKIIKDLTKIDIWSLAVTFYAASEKYFPFNEPEKPDPQKLSAKAKDSFLLLLLKKCFVLDPVHRISAKEMLDDEYFMNPVFPCSLNSLEESQKANIRNNRIACNKYSNKNMKKS
ncbi:kinase that interacts with cdc31p [Tritrichomonas musculus]|uniref:Kinase that interacts with cdc31p n=1 Tax=Tritrichomonas musculus TaxID=1915356 RepID=A0ABR2GZQ4_9EUKA